MNETSTGPPSGGPVRVCTKCKVNHAPSNSSWCRQCRNAQAAVYRARLRPKVVEEERVCAFEQCDAVFVWRSTYPRQLCCSPQHSGKYRWQRDHPPVAGEVLPDGEKRCSKCLEIKHLMEFAPSERGKGWGWCHECRRVYQRMWDASHRERRSAATRRSRAAKLLRRYGAPSDDFADLLDAQGGGCACCGGPKGVREFHIDHDHHKPEAESYRGLLCHGCNVGLGAFGEDPERLRAALRYLALDC